MITVEITNCPNNCDNCEDRENGLDFGNSCISFEPPRFKEKFLKDNCSRYICNQCMKNCLRCGKVLCKEHSKKIEICHDCQKVMKDHLEICVKKG